jgi:regulator of protease activity HflC (stomatin/prohibitin superfamily)
LGEALSFISDLWDFFISLLPNLQVVPATHSYVKFRRGKHIIEGGPGLVWYWPIATIIETVPIVRQIVNLSTQTLTTENGVPVAVGGLIMYHVDDPTVFLTDNFDADESVSEICQTCIREVVCSSSWEDLRSTYRDVTDNRITKRANVALMPYGVVVERAKLTELAKTKVVSLLHSNEEGADD